MKSAENMRNKRGEYILEAAIIMPIFVIAVTMLISIIPVISTCENIVYEVSDELRLEDARSYLVDDRITLPTTLTARAYKENRNISRFRIGSYKYKYSSNGIDDLISVDFKCNFSRKNPLGLLSKINFSGRVVSRAFTGTHNGNENASLSDFQNNSTLVYVFPDDGEKYHKEGCRYLKSNCRLVVLSQTLKKKYHACPNCNAKAADIGVQVFLFEEGKAYHTGECKSVKKYYVEIEKEKAIEEKYGACSSCNP